MVALASRFIRGGEAPGFRGLRPLGTIAKQTPDETPQALLPSRGKSKGRRRFAPTTFEGGAYLYAPPSKEQMRSAPVGIPRFAPRFLRGGEGFLPPSTGKVCPGHGPTTEDNIPFGNRGVGNMPPETLALREQPSALAPPQGTFARGSGGFDNHPAAQDRFIGGWLRKGCPQWLPSLRKGYAYPGRFPSGATIINPLTTCSSGMGETT
ncbi:hypothetical protein RRG08_015266 [Elysia crispata]|uniref:Uncharacterized protein n=1 Tax=Elysia crispata TaxID=231223 RepID=A0AAE1E3U8_9GAST|nr:hypothetical protein RRG08_015266 [Elysia crispata]